MDESAITGDSSPKLKESYESCIAMKKNSQGRQDVQIPSPVVISGTVATRGEGYLIVIAVGRNSVLGRMQSVFVDDNGRDKSFGLRRTIDDFSSIVTKSGFLFALLICITVLIRLVYNYIDAEDKTTVFSSSQLTIIISSILAAAVILALGNADLLQSSVVWSLASTVTSIIKDQCLVRKLESVEQLGYVDTIVTDKTGILTRNKMSMTRLWNFEVYSTYQPLVKYNEFVNEKVRDIFEMTVATTL